MSVTAVYTDLSEYSRYHSHLSTITTTIEVDSPTAGDVITASLFRLDGYGVVVSKEVTLTTATSYTVTFDLNKDPFIAPKAGPLAGVPNIYVAKAGDYTVNVLDTDGTTISSETFAISIVPVEEFTNEWTKGVTWIDFERLEPRLQPRVITGVVVEEISANHMKGPFTMSYTSGTPNTLSWNGGPSVSINGRSPQTLLLLTDSTPTADFIMVRVSPSQLPSTSQTEMLYVDNGRMKDSAIRDQVRRATSWVQEKIICKVEPEFVNTDPVDGVYCDEVAIPETFYRPNNMNKWMSFRIPYPRILDIAVYGFFNTSQSATVPNEWLVWDEVQGICELVPATSAEVVWSFYNGLFVLSFLFAYNSIPGFWHYNAIVGMRDLWNERAIIREAIAKKAAYEMLNSAGSAYRAGYASSSTSRDSITESNSFTSSSMSGVYGAHFNHYKEFLAKEIPKMKKRFGGLSFVTI